MAAYTYESLKTKYKNFMDPKVVIEIGGVDIAADRKNHFALSDIDVEMTCGFEASIATFRINNCYDMEKSEFETARIKKYILLGSSVAIYIGYGANVREIFRGFISKVNFLFRREDIPCVEVTAMDLKGIMMANNYSRQIAATSFSGAVKKILTEEYAKLQTLGVITKVQVSPTPDDPSAGMAGGSGIPAGTSSAGASATDKTIEMVYESDYEFIVKAAKKFNYEFFAVGGNVYFRKAKSDTDILMEIGPATGIHEISVEYDVTGLVSEVEVRSVDVGKGALVSAKQKANNKISQGSRAKQIISGTAKVYLDPTAASKEDAGYRADYLMEDMIYRYGTLEAELIGLPELTPGKFIRLVSLGTAVSNLFYLMSVRHVLADDGYITKIVGKAAKLDDGAVGGVGAPGGLF